MSFPISDKTYFIKIGKASLGGKAKGLKFLNRMLSDNPDLHKKFSAVNLFVPKTVVIATDGFDDFLSQNKLQTSLFEEESDQKIYISYILPLIFFRVVNTIVYYHVTFCLFS